jgi:serine/threonine-protein kinase RsbW
MRKTQTQSFPARYESLAAIDQFIAAAAEQAGFDECTVYQVRLAVDEACSNIIEHAYGGEGSDIIECSYRIQGEELIVILRDTGQPFDPETVPEPNLSSNLEDRTGGGLGLYLIRQIMDKVDFDFESEAGNVLTMVKRKKNGIP